jgi:hypothetical protein
VVAFIFSIIQAVPAVEKIFSQLIELYVDWKIQQNLKDETGKDARNAAAIAALGRMPVLCPTCPFANITGGQLPPTDATPPIQGSGPSGS